MLLDQLRIPRCGPGRPRTTPDALRGDKAYSAKAHRDSLRARGVKVVIPEKADQRANRKNKGSRGGRPVGFDAEDYKNRNVVERAFNKLKNWRGLATRYDKHALIYRGGMVLASIILWLTARIRRHALVLLADIFVPQARVRFDPILEHGLGFSVIKHDDFNAVTSQKGFAGLKVIVLTNHDSRDFVQQNGARAHEAR